MIGDAIVDPNHQVLVVTLIKKKQISRSRLKNVPRDKYGVALHQANSGNIGLVVPFVGLPSVAQQLLLREKDEIRGQGVVDHTAGFSPLLVVRPECLAYGKTNQTGAIPMHPAR